MARKRVRKLKITRGEKLLYTCAVLALGGFLVLKVFCTANIGHLKMNIESIRYDISTEEKKVESLTMKVNELTSFDNVKQIVKEMGLAYNNENIIIVDE